MKRSVPKAKYQQGYMLLAVMLLMTLMLIALSIELPRISQQIKREKEEELVHRGREYAVAVKRFYHKNGTYPASLEQLESTNNLRFLRRRYKDPMTESGEFKLVHMGEAQINLATSANATNSSQSNSLSTNSANVAGSGSNALGSNTGTTGGLNSGSGGLNGSPGSGGFGSGGAIGSGSGFGSGGLGSGNQTPSGGGLTTGTQGSSNQPGGTGQMGTLTTQNIGNGTGGQGGGPIIGVASNSKKTSIKEFNNAAEYDQWLFVYDPRVEQAGAGGVIIASPIGSGAPNSSGIPQPVQPVRTPSSPQ